MRRELFQFYDSGILKSAEPVRAVRREGSFLLVGAEKSPFRPASGGQPSDRGVISGDGFYAEVEDSFEDGGLIMHRCSRFSGSISEGQKVIFEVNSQLRRAYTLMHSGEHLLFACLKRVMGEHSLSVEIDKVSIGAEESSFFVRASSLNWNLMFEAEELANSIVKEGRAFRISYLAPQEALSDSDLRIKADRIKDEFVRRVEIVGVDASACTGTHVENTSELKLVLVTSLKSLGSSKFEIKFKVAEHAFREVFRHSRDFRRISALLGRSDSVFEDTLKLWNENRELKERHQQDLLRRISSITPERLFGISFYSETLEGEEQKVIVKGMSALCSKQAFVLLINRTGEEKANIYLMRSSDLDSDLLEFLNNTVFSLFSGKGGGNSGFVTAELKLRRDDERILREEVRSLILSLR
ncbi:MAG: alanine--tRNA ligase-related protein [Candidatus Woesearchaeota archaeon]